MSGWDEAKEDAAAQDQALQAGYASDSDLDEMSLYDGEESDEVIDAGEKHSDDVVRTTEALTNLEEDLALVAKDSDIDLQNLTVEQRQELNVLRRYSTKRVGQPEEHAAGGREWTAKIYRQGYYNAKNKRVFADGKIKPRRPIPMAYEDDFFSSLEEVNGKFFYRGALNDWPALVDLELVSLEYWYSRSDRVKTVTLSRKIWTHEKKERPKYPTAGSLSFQKKPICIRATMRAPSHTELGYSAGNPGFVWWFRPFRQGGPKLGHGERLIKALEMDAEAAGEPLERATKVHFFAHRYAKKVESPKDKITYHTGVLVEWDHGRYVTLIELAWLFGIGGYGGKSNWQEDRDSRMPLLWQCMADQLKAPWRTNRSEVRLSDLNLRNVDEFMSFMKSYNKRFLKPTIKGSDEVRLSQNTSTDIIRYIVNYICRDRTYSEDRRNCQTFAADFFTFLSGTGIEPLYPVKLFYKNKLMNFLYDHRMFTAKNMRKEKMDLLKNPRVKSGKNKQPAKKVYNKIFG